MRDLFVTIAALAAVMSSAAAAADTGCPTKITPELEASFGAPAAWLGAGETVHAPAGLTVLDLPVSYVLLRRSGGETGPVTEIDYRMQGLKRPYGQRYAMDLRKAFDKGFGGANCSSKEGAACNLDFTGGTADQLTNAGLSTGDLSMPKEAHGDALSLVKADYDLDGADPVFLTCSYGGAG